MKGVSVPIPSWPWWLLVGRKEREPVSNGTDALKFPSKISSCKGKVKRRWIGKGGMRKEVDHETVSLSDGGKCWYGSETDGPEWSVGWTEPHGPDFESNDEGDSGFLVLVPCYRAVVEEGSSNQLLSAVKNFPTGISPDGHNYMEQWLSALHNL
ncbi:PREDICTED: uncharacterized protein LOC104807670 [Tarenaya hassleriana]|uniref:uncharacterized protein LOC104807670 n=1 Tax=Tarenaya hassleriana TaxID=28532 RepID=UPI00053C1FCF|nr:PREDICTED: uncharacterized protein LOC104807670 [Tarenaya hassleriana]XP_010531353.1 PREDICTED: uncharacterized protein LOC104807670 [Tarenaya hassleriana]